ncbi:hypothetical protein [Bacillus atrophaeus]|uniref:hypothetical protein n=1 Tax=Bacillus atrophaeus TaxID=1452 RepID=UPI0040430128
MEKVVYVLGAGFSAPLGLPVMTNFILKAKDLYFSNQDEHPHFKEVFDLLNDMSVIKNFFNTDLYNIEETLSILEMTNYLNGVNEFEKFKKFIVDVIKYSTPDYENLNYVPGNWHRFILGTNELSKLYGCFISNLLGLEIFRNENQNHTRGFDVYKTSVDTTYSVISFNYDMVIENYFDFIKRNEIFYNYIKEEEWLDITKLHGCISKNNIVPPTWNKSSNKELLKEWQKSWDLLKDANQIRIIGYSLPITDSYIKYFFKSAIMQSKHLKKIDVITLDNPNMETKKRYDDFIDFNYYRFKDGNTKDYLETVFNRQFNPINIRDKKVTFNILEDAHNYFMSN